MVGEFVHKLMQYTTFEWLIATVHVIATLRIVATPRPRIIVIRAALG